MSFGVIVILGIVGFILPPPGRIDEMFLKWCIFPSSFAFLAVAREALYEGFGFRARKGDWEVEIKDQDGKDSERNRDNNITEEEE